MESESKIRALSDHYATNVAYLRALVRTRLLMNWAVLAVVALMLAEMGVLEFDWFVAFEVVMDPRLLNCTLWVAFVGLAVLSYEKTVLVEFQAQYVLEVEKRLDQALGGGAIDQQRRQRPTILKRISRLFLGLGGAMILLGASGKLAKEAWLLNSDSSLLTILPFLFDLAMYGVFLYYSWHFAAVARVGNVAPQQKATSPRSRR